MTENATVYAPLHGFPSEDELRELAPGASLSLRDGVAELGWSAATATLNRMPDSEMAVHLSGLCELVRNRGVPEAVPTRILSTLSVYNVVVEPHFDEDSLQFVAALAVQSDGFLFLDGQLTDCDGTDLLVPSQPGPARVAERALILLSLAFRGLIEEDAHTPEHANAEEVRQRLATWVRTMGVEAEAEPHELAFLDCPIGQADPQTVIESVWRAEGAQVLLWALGVRDLPPHDAQEHPFQVCQDLAMLQPERPALLDDPHLRADDALEWMRRRLLGINWRLTQQRVQPGICDFEAFAGDNWFGGFDIAGITVAGGDLAVAGQPIAAAHADHVRLTASIAMERHHAINWLTGVHPVYSQVVTPT